MKNRKFYISMNFMRLESFGVPWSPSESLGVLRSPLESLGVLESRDPLFPPWLINNETYFFHIIVFSSYHRNLSDELSSTHSSLRVIDRSMVNLGKSTSPSNMMILFVIKQMSLYETNNICFSSNSIQNLTLHFVKYGN